jgi:uncharacterized membrane protein (DUF485 family)
MKQSTFKELINKIRIYSYPVDLVIFIIGVIFLSIIALAIKTLTR